MRELNRRGDVGVRWSEKVIEKVLKVLFHYRLNENIRVSILFIKTEEYHLQAILEFDLK